MPKKKLTSILLIFILLIGVLAGIYLVQRSQEFREKAATLFQDNFESGLTNWTQSNQSSSIATGRGVSGNALAVRSITTDTTDTYVYRQFSNLTGMVTVMFYDDATLLRDATDDTQVGLSVQTNGGIGGLSVVVRPKTSTTNYSYCPTNNQDGCMDTKIPRTTGWHKFQINVTPKGSYGKIDDVSLSNLSANAIGAPVSVDATVFTRVNLGVFGTRQTGDFYFDNVVITDFPPPGSSRIDMSKKYLDMYLSSYGSIDVNAAIQAINSSSDYWTRTHIYLGLVKTAQAHAIRYRLNGSTTDLNKAVTIIERMASNETTRSWLDPSVNPLAGARESAYLAHTSWLVRDQLSASSKANIESVLFRHANYYTTWRGYSSFQGNSSGEENSWAGEFMYWMYLSYNYRPESQTWYTWAKTYLFHSLTTGETLNGIPTQTLHANGDARYLFDNHDSHPHPGYAMGTAHSLLYVDKLEQKYFNRVTNEFRHNVPFVWTKNRDPHVIFKSFRMNQSTVPRAYQESGGGESMVNLNFYHMMKEQYGETNSVQGISDLAQHSFEYIYYIKDSYLRTPVKGTVSMNASEFAQVNGSNTKASIWLQNSLTSMDFGMHLFIYGMNVPITRPSATPVPTSSSTPTPTRTGTPTPLPTGVQCNTCYNFNASSDGKIDVQDILFVANRWNATTGSPNYGTLYDIACTNNRPDGVINILDIQLIANKWNTNSCTP
jgi:hypothetical protein